MKVRETVIYNNMNRSLIFLEHDVDKLLVRNDKSDKVYCEYAFVAHEIETVK